MAEKKLPTQSAKDLLKEITSDRKTFTSRKGLTRVVFQKEEVERGHQGQRIQKLQDGISVALQHGVEFDPYIECKNNLTFKKLCENGYKEYNFNTKKVSLKHLSPEALEGFLHKQVQANTNKVMYWQNRKRSPREKALEGLLRDVVAESGPNSEIAKKVAALRSTVG